MCLVYMYEPFACMYIYVSGGQKKVLDTLELAGATESCVTMWVLGLDPGSSARTSLPSEPCLTPKHLEF